MGSPPSDPIEELRRLNASRERYVELWNEQEEVRQLYHGSWIELIGDHTVSNLAKVGNGLRARDGEFWVRVWECRWKRTASHRDQLNNSVLASLLRSAIADEREEMEKRLDAWASVTGIAYRISLIKQVACDFINWQYSPPPTPPMIRKEFVEAVRHIPGLSGPNVTRKVKSGIVAVEHASGQDVKLSSYRHQDDATQMAILRGVVKWFSENL